MIKAILAVDEKGGVSKDGSMPWPHNSKDLKWFKDNTKGQLIIMGKSTWIDEKMHNPLPNRINVLVTNQNPINFPGADVYIKGNLIEKIKEIDKKYPNKVKWVIGGSNIVNQLFEIINEFYLTRIYGNYNCDTFLNLDNIFNEMKKIKNIEVDNTCHFEIWSR